eukprot:4449682-Pyramimonas_sp.AAC.1
MHARCVQGLEQHRLPRTGKAHRHRITSAPASTPTSTPTSASHHVASDQHDRSSMLTNIPRTAVCQQTDSTNHPRSRVLWGRRNVRRCCPTESAASSEPLQNISSIENRNVGRPSSSKSFSIPGGPQGQLKRLSLH